MVNDVYTVQNFTAGALGGWYGTEPLAYTPNRELFFQITETRFHYPAEHTLNGATFAAEFQIFGQEQKNSVFFCETGKAAISILLNIDDNATENAFWSSWASTDTFDYDLSQLFGKTIAMNQSMLGYKGSDTMPSCDVVCWYVLVEPMTLTTDTYNAIVAKTPGVTFNNRDIQAQTNPLYNALHTSLFGPNPRPNAPVNTEL